MARSNGSELLEKSIAILNFALRVRASAGLRAFRRLSHPLRIGRYLDARALLLEQHYAARVASFPTAVARFPHLGVGKIAHAHRHTKFASEFRRELDVLGGELEREVRRIVFAGQELIQQAI